MKFVTLLLLSNLIFQNALAFKSQSAPEVFGVLVQVGNVEVLSHKDFLKIKDEFNLTQKNYFDALKVVSLIPQKIEKGKLVEFCKKIKLVPNILHCELNQKSTLDDSTGLCADCKKSEISLSIQKVTSRFECKLVPDKPSPHNQKGLSPFWAQEYTGADLLRARLTSIPNLKIPDNLFEVWDSDRHGEYVTNLIEGPHLSALIPKANVRNVQELPTTEYGVNNYQKFYEKCIKEGNCPSYINNSMGWNDSELVTQVVESIVDHGTVFITSAGNESTQLEKSKQQISKKNKLIVVGSLSPKGTASDFTCMNSELTISAPSDYHITSYNFSGDETAFGGTSGAAPQVTAALAAFTLITGHKLNTKEAKELLAKTAIMFPEYPAPNGLGSGMLNSYKIGEIAFKLKKECGNDKACIRNKIDDGSYYSFNSHEISFDQDLEKLFPNCSNYPKKIDSDSNCSEKKDLFTKIRKAALLDSTNQKLWNAIACISGEDSYTQNQKFYKKLAERKNITDKQLIHQLESTKREPELVKVLLSHENNITDEAIEKYIRKKENHSEIIKFVLLNPKLKEHPKLNKWIKHIMAKGDQVDDEAMVKYVLSNSQMISNPNWGDWVNTLLRKGTADTAIVENILANTEAMKHPDFSKWIKVIMDRMHKCKLTKHSGCFEDENELAKLVLGKYHLKNHPHFYVWINNYITQGLDIKPLAFFVLSDTEIHQNPHFNNWMDLIINKSEKDLVTTINISTNILINMNQDNPKYKTWFEMIRKNIEQFIRKNNKDSDLKIDNYFFSYIWKTYYSDKFKEKGITADVNAANIRKYILN